LVAQGLEYWFTFPTLCQINKPWTRVMHVFDPDQAIPATGLCCFHLPSASPRCFSKPFQAKLYLFATWPVPTKPIRRHALAWQADPTDGQGCASRLRAAVKEEPRYAGIVPVGLAWNRASTRRRGWQSL